MRAAHVIAGTDIYRASFELDPGREDIIELRLVLTSNGQAMGGNLAVSMESVAARQSTAMPPPALLDDARAELSALRARARLARPRLKTMAARLLTFGGALALTVYASREMIAVVSLGTRHVVPAVGDGRAVHHHVRLDRARRRPRPSPACCSAARGCARAPDAPRRCSARRS